MKSVAIPLCFIALCGACLCPAADVGQVRSVYLLPMANGFEQYLANHITTSGAFQVVVDPKKAEAIFTDRLGEAFEERLRQILPAAPVEEKKEGDKASKQPETVRVTNSTFGRGKGTLFLVETATQSVIWSVYAPPRNTTAKELNRTAQRVVENLKKPSKSN